jgi:PPOX class probable F420-dependent enzyme
VTPELHSKILGILARHNNMTIATLRPDGFPQATTVGYANDGLKIYFGCGPNSQKAQNLRRDPRVSAAIDEDHVNWAEIEGISLAGTAAPVNDADELARVAALFLAKFPQLAAFPEQDRPSMAIFRVTPSVISVLDYAKGFGHTDLVRLVAQSAVAQS